ncbi:protein FAM169B isoform X1 [Pygocentrus nattereri]|uniref:Family with sequence similarity 169 member B n=2 Tax=Pygocentrus nattereri TaxID=42514 RepID=A0AAR2JV48_PYGNA|nr:protein FAM169B isoform X1 [Pygocentrus nattereri]
MDTSGDLPVSRQGSFYPVDLACQDYHELNPDSHKGPESLHPDTKTFSHPSGAEVHVTQDNVGRLMLFGEGGPPHSLLALHTPADETQVVALYLHGKWWPIGEVLKTSSKSRHGLLIVQSVMERVILFLLSQIIFGVMEKPLGESMYFSAPSALEYGKILWQDGEAVGFYTIKKKGSLCDGCTGQSYLLPVLDTVFVRTHWRRNGLALQMLQDFCTSMSKESVLGISRPVSTSMYGVCKKYLETHKEQRERLYEVDAPGEWSQRRNVWLNIQLQHRPAHSANSDGSPHSTRAMARTLIDNKGKVLEGIPQVHTSAVKGIEANKP